MQHFDITAVSFKMLTVDTEQDRHVFPMLHPVSESPGLRQGEITVGLKKGSHGEHISAEMSLQT